MSTSPIQPLAPMPEPVADDGKVMSAKEAAELYLKLAEYAAARHQRRSDVEWKMSFALWLILLAPYVSAKDITLPPSLHVHPLIAGGAIAFTYALLWLRPLWLANHSDKQLADHSWKIAEKILRTGSSTGHERPPPKSNVSFFSLTFLQDWAIRVHFVITLLLAMLFASVVK